MNFSAGKLNMEFLERLLTKYTHKDRRVVAGAKVGEDAAVIDMGEKYLVAKSDPITFTTEEIGYYGVNINANDIATMGATPKWLLATLLLPEGKTDEEIVERIFKGISEACANLEISLIGGHTEVTHSIDRPIFCGHMLGEVEKNELVLTEGAKDRDLILLTKGICIEGTSIIAREKRKDLIERGYSEEFLNRASNFLYSPGIGVVKDARIACGAAKVTSMHDPTEGGLATGLMELAKAAHVGLMVDEEKIPLFEESKILCEEYGLNPLGTISSGALLLTASSKDAESILKAFSKEGRKIGVIGKILEDPSNILLKTKDDYIPIPYFEKDEIVKIF